MGIVGSVQYKVTASDGSMFAHRHHLGGWTAHPLAAFAMASLRQPGPEDAILAEDTQRSRFRPRRVASPPSTTAPRLNANDASSNASALRERGRPLDREPPLGRDVPDLEVVTGVQRHRTSTGREQRTDPDPLPLLLAGIGRRVPDADCCGLPGAGDEASIARDREDVRPLARGRQAREKLAGHGVAQREATLLQRHRRRCWHPMSRGGGSGRRAAASRPV